MSLLPTGDQITYSTDVRDNNKFRFLLLVEFELLNNLMNVYCHWNNQKTLCFLMISRGIRVH